MEKNPDYLVSLTPSEITNETNIEAITWDDVGRKVVTLADALNGGLLCEVAEPFRGGRIPDADKERVRTELEKALVFKRKKLEDIKYEFDLAVQKLEKLQKFLEEVDL